MTNSIKTTFAIVLVLALFAGPASAQAPPTEEVEDRTAILEELVESQERLIKQQQALINDQEALLNAYRCMFKVDVEVVPGGCPSLELTEAEAADGALLCPGYRAEAQDTELIAGAWALVAQALEQGLTGLDDPRLLQMFGGVSEQSEDVVIGEVGNLVDGYRARVLAIIPNLNSERFTGLFNAMADSIQVVFDTFTGGGPADEMAAAVRTALERLSELNAALAELCG